MLQTRGEILCLKYLHGAAKDGAQINCCFQFRNTIAQITCSFALINHSAIWTPYISLSYHLPFYAYILSFNISNLLLHITHYITDWKTVIDVLPSAKNCFILGTAHTEIVKEDSLVYVMFFAIIMFQWVDTHFPKISISYNSIFNIEFRSLFGSVLQIPVE